MRRLNLSDSVRRTGQNDPNKIKLTVAAAPPLQERLYQPFTDSWPWLFPSCSEQSVCSCKSHGMGRILFKGRQFMTLASGGATGVSSPLPTRPAPERQIGFLPFTPPRTHEGR